MRKLDTEFLNKLQTARAQYEPGQEPEAMREELLDLYRKVSGYGGFLGDIDFQVQMYKRTVEYGFEWFLNSQTGVRFKQLLSVDTQKLVLKNAVDTLDTFLRDEGLTVDAMDTSVLAEARQLVA